MAWIPIYLNKGDINILNDFLNSEQEIAFLISVGKNKWIAKSEWNILADIEKDSFIGEYYIPKTCEYSMWHIPSGKLPVYNLEEVFIDPWKEWTEDFEDQRRTPFFGADCTKVFTLTIKIDDNEIPMSGVEWIRNYYKIIGKEADKSTDKFWNKLRRFIKKNSIQIPRCNDSLRKPEIFAFENAYREIQNGKNCSLNP
ncbi:hypothetical protein [Soonwooa purpurea]